MKEVDKLKPHGQDVLSSIPTLQEALWQARLIAELSYNEDPQERLDHLNLAIDHSIGSIAYVEGAIRYISKPLGYAAEHPEGSPIPNHGVFRGFTCAEGIDEEPNGRIYAEIHHGEISYETPLAQGSCEINSFYPVNAITHISSHREPFFSLQGINANGYIGTDVVFSAIERAILETQRTFKNKKALTDKRLEAIERWDCREELLGTEEMRRLMISVAADTVILQYTDESARSTRVKFEDIYFIGFYAGVVNLATNAGRSKPYFAFEVCDGPLTDIIDAQENLPIAFVPVAKHQNLIVEQIDLYE
jgi:hypothetical protein